MAARESALTCSSVREAIELAVKRAAEESEDTARTLGAAGSIQFWVRRGRGREGARGDFVSNVALVLASLWRLPAEETAQRISRNLIWPGSVEEANGFLNFHMSDETIKESIERALAEEERYGSGDALGGNRIVVEFVSADPTGPLPFSAGRSAAMGDALCRILEFQGASVTREFYLNDAASSSKMRLLGESVSAHYLRAFGRDDEPPEGILDDAFVRGVASAIASRDGNQHLLLPDEERTALFARKALEAAVAAQKQTLREFGVRFDVWTSEQALHEEGRVKASLDKLRERGHLYERDGAQWLRTTGFGDEADRPLLRANQQPTYLATDIAYHIFKMERGFDRIINIWTAEHHLYIDRTRAALNAAGCHADKVEVITCESARWLRDGLPVRRGKSGDVFTLDEALREVGRETLRFWLLRRDWSNSAEIEVEQARRDDEANPAYAARLVPARLSTLIRELEAHTGSSGGEGQAANGDAAWWNEAQKNLARLVALWPDTARTAALDRQPQRVAQFVSDMAGAVRSLVAASRPGDAGVGGNDARLKLLRAARITATNALNVLGMDAPARL